MLRARNREIDESSFEFAGQPVRLTSRETTLQLGRPTHVVALTYRRPGHVSLGDADESQPILEYGVFARMVPLLVERAALIKRRYRR